MARDELKKITIYCDKDIENIVIQYIDNKKKQISDIITSAETQEFSLAEKIGHGLKGSGRLYGFDYISKVGSLIEQASRIRSQETILLEVKELQEYLKNLDIKFK